MDSKDTMIYSRSNGRLRKLGNTDSDSSVLRSRSNGRLRSLKKVNRNCSEANALAQLKSIKPFKCSMTLIKQIADLLNDGFFHLNLKTIRFGMIKTRGAYGTTEKVYEAAGSVEYQVTVNPVETNTFDLLAGTIAHELVHVKINTKKDKFDPSHGDEFNLMCDQFELEFPILENMVK